jgi:phytol kinase
LTRGDALGLGLSYAYAFGMLAGVEALGRRLRWPQEVTRKVIHIGAGMWVWGVLACFDSWTWGLVPFATFIPLNYVFHRRQTFSAMDREASSLGTVYFAFSVTLLMAALWRTGPASPDRAPLAVAAIMAMTWGDALASLIGRPWGRHRFRVFGHVRSIEGSLAMAAGTFAAVALTLVVLPGSSLSPTTAALTPATILTLAAVATAVATPAEALSPAGMDNLSVPLLVGLTLDLLDRVLG